MFQKEMEELAFVSALGNILSEIPEDISDGSPLMLWYEGQTDEMPEDMVVWEPHENDTDDYLRELIANTADDRLTLIEQVAERVRSSEFARMNGEYEHIAKTLEEGVDADIFYDANDFDEIKLSACIKNTKQAMKDAATLLRLSTKVFTVANLDSLLEISRQVLECPSMTKLVAESMDVSDEEMSRLREGLNSLTEEIDASAAEPFTPMQKAVVEHYQGGEFAHLSCVRKAEDAGDGLLTFLLREIGDVAGNSSDEDAVNESVRALYVVSNQVAEVAHNLQAK